MVDARKILDVLANCGLKTEITEVCPFLMADLITFILFSDWPTRPLSLNATMGK
ncbi:hypothetical protein [Desulfovibrio sp. SGI.169]|uniref:hypothetical protein n=1 Tax=Desulfovibrio sp. SGI.169 TaxID=3420561 RepID=UPI003D06C15A